MRALLVEGFPAQLKDDSGQSSFTSGTIVYREEVLKALLSHANLDAFFFLSRTPFLPPAAGETERLSRIDARARAISVCDIDILSEYDEVVMFAPTANIAGFVPLRSQRFSARWIASGVVHSLDSRELPLMILALMRSDVDEADSLICSTSTGKAVLEQLFDGRPECPPGYAAADRAPRRAGRPSLPVIPLGIDADSYQQLGKSETRKRVGIPDSGVAILYLGRISPISKCDLMPLVHAFARLIQRTPEAWLVIGGDDTQHGMTDFLVTAAEVLGCGGRLTVRPNINDQEKRELIAAADIFVSPSDNTQETFGLAVAEAMAGSLPVVASEWNGYKELVEHDETGFLVPTRWFSLGGDLDRLATGSFFFRNSVLATATVVDIDLLEFYLQTLVERPELRESMGRAGRRRAACSYDWSVVIRQYEALWEESLLKARALRADKASFGACPVHYAYQQVFGHYPSQSLGDHTVLSLTGVGRKQLDSQHDLDVVTSPNGIINLDHLTQILQIAADEGGSLTTVDLVSRATRRSGFPRLVTLTHVAFSLKYGFLSCAAQTEANQSHPRRAV